MNSNFNMDILSENEMNELKGGKITITHTVTTDKDGNKVEITTTTIE